MTINFDTHALLSFLKEKDLKPELQKETEQIFIAMDIQGHEVPVFFVFREESQLLQTVAYLPYQLHAKTFGEVARMLHMLNRELDMPGFGLDESEKVLFFRCVIPCTNKKIDTQLLNMYLGTTKIAIDTFLQAIGVIVSGMTTVDEVLKQQEPPKNAS